MANRSLFITATDLKQWANHRDAQGDLPRLVRRLIHGTVLRILRRAMPAGESVQSGGWDGIVVVEGGNEFAPEGTSVWEFGAGKDPSGKAQEDYDKRTQDPKGVDPQTSTFICVTPRTWQGKTEWAIARMKEGKWLEVRAYDADDLELWLELAPAVQLWFAQYVNKLPEAAIDVDTFWRDWAEATNPALTPDFVLAGRQKTATTIHQWLQGADTTLAVKAETLQEAIAAFAASLLMLPDEERLTWLARTAVVESAAAWTRLAVAPSGLVLIPLFDVGNLLARATRGGHRVVVPLGQADQTTDTTSAPPLDEKVAAKELVNLGLTPGRAWELALMARRSMMAFRRAIAIRPEVQQPEWAKPVVARGLLPILLAGAWQESHAGDRHAVAGIAGSTYEGVQENMLRWGNESDPPVRRVGDTWYVVSPQDAWNLLSRYLTRDDLERFEKTAVDLLGTPDPRFDLPPKDWSAARALDAKPLQSELLRRNVAEAVAMLATHGDRVSIGSAITAADFAVRIVLQVLEKAQEDWRVWASLSDIDALPPLAQAAPDVFLAAVERGVSGPEPVLLRLFTDKDDAFFSRTQHTGLLNALEALAWSKDYFGRVSRLVAALARIDPGGKYANRPSVTLLHFFWPERPFTMATADVRLAALDAILAREGEVGWTMLLDLFPHHFGRLTLFGTHPPQWMSVSPEQYERPNKQDVEATLLALGDRVVASIAAAPRRATDTIGILDRLPNRTRDEVLTHLESLPVTTLSQADQLEIWTALRDYMQPYKRRGESLPLDIARIEALYVNLEPHVDADRVLWLFDARPPFDEFEGSWEEKQRALRERQKEALATIVGGGGFDTVLALIPRAGRSDILGSVAGELQLEDAVALKIGAETLSSSDAATLNFGRGYMSALIRTRGSDWAEKHLAAHSEWSSVLRAEVLTLLPQHRRAWTILNDESDEVRRLYWQRMEVWALPENEIATVAEGYLQAGRPYAVIDYLAEHVRKSQNASVPLILPLVERAMKSTPAGDKPSESFSYNLGELLTALAQGATAEEESRVALLEWSVLPILTRQERPTEMLHRQMSRNPEFFAEVVRAVRVRNREGESSTKEDQMYAFAAHQLLASWQGVPADERLAAWVTRARAELAADGLAKKGDVYIGTALSAAPVDADGTWPPRAVRDVIETVASDALEQGFSMGVHNARGVTWRGEFEGGAQERDLAAKYDAFAASIAGGWGRTAALLRGLAKSYSAEARREDASASLWRDLEI